jgi:hypothetical protein
LTSSRSSQGRLAGAALALATVLMLSCGACSGNAGGRSVIIGTNDAAGWGPHAAARIRSAHIVWDRVDLRAGPTHLMRQSTHDHFRVLAIVGNLPDESPLSSVEPAAWAAYVVHQLRANPGATLAEAGNEMYLKGGRAEPVRYARMYMAALGAMRAAGIHIPLLFNMRGDYERPGSRSWSLDSSGGGWLGDALKAVPGLGAAILTNGISVHPYGAIGENSHDTYGVLSVPADEHVARRLLGAYPNFYITEFGFNLAGCGTPPGACSQSDQASKLRVAYGSFLSDAHVAGIWWYQSHSDSTGDWGYLNRDNSPRPAYGALAQIAAQELGL